MHKGLKQINVGRIMQITQKVAILTLFFSMIFMILYSLIFMTPFYNIYKLDQPFLFKNMTQFGDLADRYKETYKDVTEAFTFNAVTGNMNGVSLKYFTDYTRKDGIQVYNHWLFNFGVIGLLVSILPFVFFSQKRKRYYVSNYIVIGISSVFNLYVGLSILINGAVWRQYVAGQNFEIINAYTSYLNEQTSIIEYYSMDKLTWIFDLGVVVGVVIIASAIFSVAMAVCKFLYQRKMPKIDFSEVKINE